MKHEPEGPTALFVVDRREGDVVIVVDDAGATTEIPADLLRGKMGTEGAVLRVPLSTGGAPSWEEAIRDRAEERRRRAAIAKRIQRLGRTDPGGDIEL